LKADHPDERQASIWLSALVLSLVPIVTLQDLWPLHLFLLGLAALSLAIHGGLRLIERVFRGGRSIELRLNRPIPVHHYAVIVLEMLIIWAIIGVFQDQVVEGVLKGVVLGTLLAIGHLAFDRVLAWYGIRAY
jgi:hypothetical protein